MSTNSDVQAAVRVAIVTGAASGIGAATARRLASEGWAVVAVDLVDTVKVVADEHDAITACVADLSDDSGNQQMVDAALGSNGRIDALVLNAGVAGQGRIGDSPIVELDRMYAVNVRAVVAGVQAALPALRESKGAVSVTCSVSGLRADPNMWAYNTTKGAAVNFVRTAAFDLGPDGIRVNGVCPGPIAGTGMTLPLEQHRPEIYEAMRTHLPLQRWGRPEEVAAAHAFLVSEDASFITGVLLPVDGGVTSGTGQFVPGGLTSPEG
jgi:meso-butanediol dehydrogenase/(S,S)-butanediol dehydrogenase/diacetyl reductase